jgi:hypothetical protein
MKGEEKTTLQLALAAHSDVVDLPRVMSLPSAFAVRPSPFVVLYG